jgi:ParB-like chromosome segregation protein Spo0J
MAMGEDELVVDEVPGDVVDAEEAAVFPAGTVLEVAISHLRLSDVREERDAEALAGLVESMRTLGLIHPILVTREDDGFRVVCGRRRVRAAEALGWETIPAVLWELDDVRRQLAVISENLHRMELTGPERDAAFLKYVQLYGSLFPNSEQDAQDRRFANIMKDEEKREEILARPVVDTPNEAAAKAFGVKPPTVGKALRRARAFTHAQRKILEDVAAVPDRQLDILASEDADTIESVVKLIAVGFGFDDAMRQVLEEQGRDYLRPAAFSGSQEPARQPAPQRTGSPEDLLKILPGRRAILDTEAFDGDVSLFLKLAKEIEVFKQRVDWSSIEQQHGKGPHGLYYRRLRLALCAPHPKSWSACGCQFSHDPNGPMNCPTCRGGGYQIGG